MTNKILFNSYDLMIDYIEYNFSYLGRLRNISYYKELNHTIHMHFLKGYDMNLISVEYKIIDENNKTFWVIDKIKVI